MRMMMRMMMMILYVFRSGTDILFEDFHVRKTKVSSIHISYSTCFMLEISLSAFERNVNVINNNDLLVSN